MTESSNESLKEISRKYARKDSKKCLTASKGRKRREGAARNDAQPKRIPRIAKVNGVERVQKGSTTMTAIMIETKQMTGREMRMQGVPSIAAREAALTRLLSVLEAGAPEYVHIHTENTLESGLELSQLARLRAAHAAYALATGGSMHRLGHGAWMRERSA